MAKPLPWLVPAVWTGGVMPCVVLAVKAPLGQLGSNPVDHALNRFGFLGLICLIASLACTPLQNIYGWAWPARVRRHFGLLGFGYITLHFLTYAVLDHSLELKTIVEDVVKRPFITFGFTAWVMLLPLAWTSRASMVKKLGYVRWKRLHRLAYGIGGLGCLHFIMREKTMTLTSISYALVFTVLMLLRLRPKIRSGTRGRTSTASGS